MNIAQNQMHLETPYMHARPHDHNITLSKQTCQTLNFKQFDLKTAFFVLPAEPKKNYKIIKNKCEDSIFFLFLNDLN